MPYGHLNTRTLRSARRATSEATVDLRRRRTWRGEGEGDAGGERQNEQQGDQQGDGKYNPKDLDEARRIIDALNKRVGERETAINQLKAQNTSVSERLAAIERAQKEKLEKEGDYRSLADQRAAELAALAPIKERAEALEKVIRESNEARIGKLPEDARTLVPVDYSPEKLQAWLNANETRLTKPPAPKFDAGAGSGGKGAEEVKVTDADRRAAEVASASGYKVTAEEIAKRREGKTTKLNE
ncbi:MAG: hypothetical protein JNL34_01865 [Anaerolineae bacterium]|nr:hypothetical protein [Anaerolineae bacterium]